MIDMRYSENVTPCAECLKKGIKKTFCIEVAGEFICSCGGTIKPEEHALIRELRAKK